MMEELKGTCREVHFFDMFCLWLQGCLGKCWNAGFGAVALNELLQSID